MLSLLSTNLLLFLLISIISVSAVIILAGMLWGLYTAKKNNLPNKMRTILISVSFILIAAVSWILNFGWLRFFMTFLLVPFLHAVIFFLINWFISAHTDKSKKIKLFNLLFCITYLLTYIFLPDAADHGEAYFLFGLIHSDILSDAAYAAASAAFVAHIVFLILQIIEFIKLKKNKKIAKKDVEQVCEDVF